MTQTPYYQPGQAPGYAPTAPQYPVAPQPQYPQQGYPAPAPPQQYQQPYGQPYPQQPAPQYPQQGYPAPAPPQQYQQPYGQPYPQQPAPQVPLAQGNLDDYYNQPSATAGASISWSNPDRSPKPLGTSYAGVVARDVTNADVQQDTDPSTGQPKFYRDNRPKFVMKVPLKVPPSQEFPDGEATWFVRGQARDELVRAMGESHCQGAPKANAVIQVTLVQRRPSRMGNPANIVQVVYQPAPGEVAAQTSQPASQPAQPAQPVQAAPEVQQYPQPVTGAPSPVPVAASQQVQQVPQQPQYQQQIPAQQVPAQQVQQVAPQQYQQQAPQGQQLPAPAGLSQEQQELLARITGQPVQGQPAA